MILRSAVLPLLLVAQMPAAHGSGEGWQFSAVRHVVEGAADPQYPLCLDVIGELGLLALDPAQLAPGRELVQVTVDLLSGNALGLVENQLLARHCTTGQVFWRRDLPSFIQSALDDERPVVDFGTVALGTRAMIKLPLTSREPGGVRAVSVSSDPGSLGLDLAADGRSVTLALPAESPWGPLGGLVDVDIESRHQSRLQIEWRAHRPGPVLARPERVRLPAASSEGTGPVVSVELRSADGSPLGVRSLDVVGIEVELRRRPCSIPGEDCLQLELSARDQQSALGELRVGVADRAHWLRVPLVQRARAAVTTAASESRLEGSPGPADPGARLRSALAETVRQDPPEGRGPVLSWRVRNEDAVFGFLVYRAERAEGPFRRVNPEVIRADPAHGGQYHWRDESADPQRVWYYAVEAVSLQGRKSPLTGVLRREAE